MLHDLIDAHKLEEGGKQKDFYERYKQTEVGVPVFTKPFQNYEKVTEKIPNDFFGDIVDLKTGYMGNEIVIGIDSRQVGDAEREEQTLFLETWAKRESTTDKNSELVKMAANTGKSYRLLFVSDDRAVGEERPRVGVQNLDPWETVVYRDGTIQTPTFAMHYFTVTEKQFSMNPNSERTQAIPPKEKLRVEWYDGENITYYRENDDSRFVLDESVVEGGVQKHLFSGVPIIEFKNNEEGLAEAKKVTDLIDAYDNIISDSTSEVEQLRMAYMWARGAGMKLDNDFEQQLQQTGIWPLPADGEIGFAGKNLGGAAGFVTSMLDEIRNNIYSFSKSIDLSHDRGGGMRVIGWQIAMLRLEMSAQVTERKFKRSYLQQYQLLSQYWQTFENVTIDPLRLKFIFTRRFPKDVDQEIDTLIKAIEVMPLEDAYAMMSFIENPAELAEKFRDEKPEMAGIMTALDETPDDETSDDENAES